MLVAYAAEPAEARPLRLRAVDRIRASARHLFYRHGIRAVGVDEIVTRAGVTKPSLYRSFPSKDELAADYLRGYDLQFWENFDAAMGPDDADPRARFLDYLSGLGGRACRAGYRGCGLTNAAVEYPDPGHPARAVSAQHKRELRRRLHDLATRMGAPDPALLGDGLLLLLEGTYASGQIGADGPALALANAADILIAGCLAEGRRLKP